MEGEQQAGEALGVQQRDSPGGEDEGGVGGEDPAVVGVWVEQGLDHEGAGQQQADDEAAVQVHPDQHDRQQPERGRRAVGSGRDQAAAPQREAWPGQQMRAGEHGRRGIGQRDDHAERGIDAGQEAAQMVDQDGGGEAGRRCGEDHDARDAVRPPRERH